MTIQQLQKGKEIEAKITRQKELVSNIRKMDPLYSGDWSNLLKSVLTVEQMHSLKARLLQLAERKQTVLEVEFHTI